MASFLDILKYVDLAIATVFSFFSIFSAILFPIIKNKEYIYLKTIFTISAFFSLIVVLDIVFSFIFSLPPLYAIISLTLKTILLVFANYITVKSIDKKSSEFFYFVFLLIPVSLVLSVLHIVFIPILLLITILTSIFAINMIVMRKRGIITTKFFITYNSDTLILAVLNTFYLASFFLHIKTLLTGLLEPNILYIHDVFSFLGYFLILLVYPIFLWFISDIVINFVKHLEDVYKDIRKEIELNDFMFKKFLFSLIDLLEARDPQTAGHSLRVAKVSRLISKKLGLPSSKVNLIEMGAMFHDIGKIGIPDKILLKPEALTPEEWQIMKTHPMISKNILEKTSYLVDIVNMAFLHHERLDGSGYPLGLKGKEIPLDAMIVAVADVYDALRTKRYYKEAMDVKDVVKTLEKLAEMNKLDKKVIEALKKAKPWLYV